MSITSYQKGLLGCASFDRHLATVLQPCLWRPPQTPVFQGIAKPILTHITKTLPIELADITDQQQEMMAAGQTVTGRSPERVRRRLTAACSCLARFGALLMAIGDAMRPLDVTDEPLAQRKQTGYRLAAILSVQVQPGSEPGPWAAVPSDATRKDRHWADSCALHWVPRHFGGRHRSTRLHGSFQFEFDELQDRDINTTLVPCG